MNVKAIASLLIAASAALAAPAFASGYGPAPSYDPVAGAPASQRGQSVQTLAAEQAANGGTTAYGGVHAQSDSGGRAEAGSTQSLYLHR